jgi:hypothetical protein
MLASAKLARHGDQIHLRLLHISAVSAGREKSKKNSKNIKCNGSLFNLTVTND